MKLNCFLGLLAFFIYCIKLFFVHFSLDFCKGRMSKHTLQTYLKPGKILPLGISAVLTPDKPAEENVRKSHDHVGNPWEVPWQKCERMHVHITHYESP